MYRSASSPIVSGPVLFLARYRVVEQASRRCRPFSRWTTCGKRIWLHWPSLHRWVYLSSRHLPILIAYWKYPDTPGKKIQYKCWSPLVNVPLWRGKTFRSMIQQYKSEQLYCRASVTWFHTYCQIKHNPSSRYFIHACSNRITDTTAAESLKDIFSTFASSDRNRRRAYILRSFLSVSLASFFATGGRERFQYNLKDVTMKIQLILFTVSCDRKVMWWVAELNKIEGKEISVKSESFSYEFKLTTANGSAKNLQKSAREHLEDGLTVDG